jgi:hypothetical protein
LEKRGHFSFGLTASALNHRYFLIKTCIAAVRVV